MLPAGLLSVEAHAKRRDRLMARLGRPVLLMGNGPLPRNLPMNILPFRQDSNLLYFTGCDLPNAAALITVSGCTLFLPLPAQDDALWHGVLPTAKALQSHFGVESVQASEELESRCAQLPEIATLAVSDPIRNALTKSITGADLQFGHAYGDLELVDAIIDMRRIKSDAEAQAHREAAKITTLAHCAAMGATRIGGHEREIAALFDGVLAANGCVNGYHSIVTVRGEVLHNPNYTHILGDGDLLLLDGGAELPTGYGCDVTRTWPVNGRFSPRQASAYAAVLEAQKESIALCRPGVRYREVHLASAKILAQWLVDEGLLNCSATEAFETGAHALFFPHGVGHFLGLDVHDLEQFGDRPSYPSSQPRDSQFGLSYLRLDMPLQQGHLVTVEPGFYVVDAILDDPAIRETHKSRLNLEAAAAWRGFGGIRIEDDILVTSGEPENLTDAIPREIQAIEEKTGASQEAAARFRP
jgi:Xaa-Pro aminopeptidase